MDDDELEGKRQVRMIGDDSLQKTRLSRNRSAYEESVGREREREEERERGDDNVARRRR